MDSGEEEPARTVGDVEFATDVSPESDSSLDSDAGDGDPPRNPAAQRGIGRARGMGRGRGGGPRERRRTRVIDEGWTPEVMPDTPLATFNSHVGLTLRFHG